jgi:hypothetical protein
MRADPWRVLRVIGWGALILGSLNFLRLFPLDWPGILASWWCGWALLRRYSTFLLATAIAGGIVLADSVLSIVLLGPILLRELGRDRLPWEGDLRPFLIPQMLHYGVQAVFWPWAVATVLRNQEARGVTAAYAVHTRDTVIGAFCVAAWISLVVQLWIKTLAFRLV